MAGLVSSWRLGALWFFSSVCYTGTITLKPIELHQDERIGFLCILNIHSEEGHHVVFFLFFLFFLNQTKNQNNKKPQRAKKSAKGVKQKKKPNTVPFIMASLALYSNDSAAQLLWQCGYNDIKILTLYRIALQNSPPTEKRRQHLVLLCMSGCPTPFIFPCIFCDYEEV